MVGATTTWAVGVEVPIRVGVSEVTVPVADLGTVTTDEEGHLALGVGRDLDTTVEVIITNIISSISKIIRVPHRFVVVVIKASHTQEEVAMKVAGRILRAMAAVQHLPASHPVKRTRTVGR